MPRVYTSLLSTRAWSRWSQPGALACVLASLTVACGDGGAGSSPRRGIPGGAAVSDGADVTDLATARRELERPPPLATARHRDERPALFGSLWRAVGPAAIRGGQVENVSPDGKVAGAVHVVVPHPTDRNRLWIGTVNGGVWETRNARATNPTWRPLTDDRSSSSVAALELDPTDPQSRTLLAGFGNVSSYGASGVIGGLIYTRDGGQSWTELSDPLFADSSVTGVVARGPVLVAATSGMFGSFAPGGVFRSTDRGQSWVRIPDIVETDTFDLTGDPANPSRLYLTTPRAVYRSDDVGGHWTNISAADPRVSALLDDFTVSLAEVDVGAGGRVFLIITRFGNGAYIGYSDGAGWTEMDLPYTPESGLSAIDEVGFDEPFGVTLTSPGHNLFTGALVEVTGLGDLGVTDGVYIAIVFDPDHFVLYETVGSGSYGGGGQWRLVNGTNPKSKSNGNPSPFGTIRRPGGQGMIHLSIAGDPRDRNIVYVGGDRQDLNFFGPELNYLGAQDYSGRLFRGDTRIARTGGVLSPQWAHLTHRTGVPGWLTGGTASASAPHADSRDLELDAAGDLLEGDDGGIFRRTRPRDNTGDWSSLVGNLQITELHDIAYDRVSRTVIGGAQDTGTPMSTPGSAQWFDYTTGDGADVAVDDTTLADQGLSIRYTGFPGWAIAIRSTWDAAGNVVAEEFPSMFSLDGDFVQSTFTTPVELNAVDPHRLVIGARNRVFESFDQAETVQGVGPGITRFQNAMVYGGWRGATANPDILYYGTGNQVFRRASAGVEAAPTAAPFPGGTVRDLALAPRDHDAVYAVDPTRVFASRDGGASWRELTGDLVDGSLRSLVVVQVVPGVRAIVVGGLTGVWITWQLGDQLPAQPTWFRLGTNLPTAPVWDLDWDARDRVLTVATLGRGAWQARFD